MKFVCIMTGSRHNQYLLTAESGKTLIIECGVKPNELLINIDNIKNISGCILSHFHSDHNAINGKKTTAEFLEQAGIKVLSPQNCIPLNKYKLGEFEIIPLLSVHNALCYGYLIKVDNNVTYFATDTNKLVKIKGINVDNYLVECNYCDYLVDIAYTKDDTDSKHLKGIMENHLSLEKLIDYFKNLDTEIKNIITLHSSNSGYFDKNLVLEKLEIYAKNVNVCENNTEYEL